MTNNRQFNNRSYLSMAAGVFTLGLLCSIHPSMHANYSCLSMAAGVFTFCFVSSMHSSMPDHADSEKSSLEKQLYDAVSQHKQTIHTVNKVRSLLKRGADPNKFVFGYASALTKALCNTRDRHTLSIVKALLAAGANPNPVKRVAGFTPLMTAVALGTEELVQVLLDAGADVTMTDELGRTIFDIAKEHLKDRGPDEERKIVEVLVKHISNIAKELERQGMPKDVIILTWEQIFGASAKIPDVQEAILKALRMSNVEKKAVEERLKQKEERRLEELYLRGKPRPGEFELE